MLQLIYKKLPLNMYSINNNLKQKKKKKLAWHSVCVQYIKCFGAELLHIYLIVEKCGKLVLKGSHWMNWDFKVPHFGQKLLILEGVEHRANIILKQKKSELSKTECSKTNIMWRELAKPFIAKQERCCNVKANQVSEI